MSFAIAWKHFTASHQMTLLYMILLMWVITRANLNFAIQFNPKKLVWITWITLPWNIYLIGLYLKLSSHHIINRIIWWYIMYLNYSVCSLTQLEDLELSWNKKLTTLSDRIGDLKSLKKLNGSMCNITQIPDKWANKSFHDLSPHHNWFFVHTLIDGTLIFIT